ncbi:hypothetical protein HGA13_10675 [Nocardia speluncae]|uniref:Uncharacterized protein n=1 Tax=Nocardia speluncae TaxID=419477 RepID=A0A846XI59_9NOCA|nr:hypothetical protein [Nocardia speluncae]NKY33534.1 hypothetical protein [Nocardia speluncae]
MRYRPTAFGYVDPDVSRCVEWDRAQVYRLARHLGYSVMWHDLSSVLPLFDQVRAADVDAVVVPGPDHLGPLELNRVMDVADVETVLPRLSFARWSMTWAGQ